MITSRYIVNSGKKAKIKLDNKYIIKLGQEMLHGHRYPYVVNIHPNVIHLSFSFNMATICFGYMALQMKMFFEK